MKQPANVNAALYAEGRRYAGRIDRMTTRGGVSPPAARERLAAVIGLGVKEVKTAVDFRTAVDKITANAGRGARTKMLAGGRHLTPELVMRISRTHPDRQSFALGQVDRGLHPFAKPPAGVDPPFDTLGVYEIRSRLARGAGLIRRAAEGVAAAPGGTLLAPEPAKIAAIVAGMVSACSAMRADLGPAAVRADGPDAAGGRRRTGGPGRRPPVRPPLAPERAPALAASALGLVQKCARDLPRLLRESPPTTGEVASVVLGLDLVEQAAGGLGAAVRGCVPPGNIPVWGGGCPVEDEAPTKPRGLQIVQASGGPGAAGGTYVVVYHLDADLAGLRVGALGTFDLPAGFYCYVGSAFGPGGVKARVGRHLTPVKAHPLWNIDFLTPHARAVEAWWTHDGARRECTWSAAMAASPASDCPATEFGARDCRKVAPQRIGAGLFRCASHLYRSDRRPVVADFARRLGALAPGHAPVYRQRLDGPGPKAAPRRAQ